jgi:uncharacterized membrane protein YfbV (UPF0208 family)
VVIRVFIGIVALWLVGTGVFATIVGPRMIGLNILALGLLGGWMLGKFAITGVSPFRADQVRDLREKRAAKRKPPNL